MILKIDLPKKAWGEQNINLGGLRYKFTYRYNSRDNGWRVSIHRNQEAVIVNEKLVPSQPIRITTKIPLFNHGILGLFKTNKTLDQPGRDNVGNGEDYELIYLSLDEFA